LLNREARGEVEDRAFGRRQPHEIASHRVLVEKLPTAMDSNAGDPRPALQQGRELDGRGFIARRRELPEPSRRFMRSEGVLADCERGREHCLFVGRTDGARGIDASSHSFDEAGVEQDFAGAFRESRVVALLGSEQPQLLRLLARNVSVRGSMHELPLSGT
jgi:hypothetical protein